MYVEKKGSSVIILFLYLLKYSLFFFKYSFTNIFHRRSLYTLYWVYPYLTYCCQVWGAMYLYNIEILNKLQKKAIRIICSQSKYAHTESLYKELKILDVKNIYMLIKWVSSSSDITIIYCLMYSIPILSEITQLTNMKLDSVIYSVFQITKQI